MEIEKSVSQEALISFLEALTAALKNKTSTVQLDDLTIQLPSTIECELEYEEQEGIAELEIELKWSKNDLDEPVACHQRTGVYELFRGKDELWYWHLKSSNYQIILVSQGYHSKAAALKGIESVKLNADVSHFERRSSQLNQPYFVLKAGNGEIIGRSQMYRRKAGCEKGIRSVMTHAGASIVECA